MPLSGLPFETIEVRGAKGTPLRVQPEPSFDVSNIFNPGVILFEEPCGYPHSNPLVPVCGAWNDGAGSASIDWEQPFNGKPSVRLDPQGNVTGGTTDPTSSPLTSGVVWKRRLQFADHNGVYSTECWIRWTSTNLSTNCYTVVNCYNRDGTNGHYGRMWIDTTVDPVSLKYLDSTGTYVQIGTCNINVVNHMYELGSGRVDVAGQWSFARLVVDFTNWQYVGFQFNDVYYDLSGIGIRTITSSGARAMHFGVDLVAKNATVPRYINVAELRGRRYS